MNRALMYSAWCCLAMGGCQPPEVRFRDRVDLTITFDKTRILANDEGQAVGQAIRESGFWGAPHPNDMRKIVTMDGEGANWIIEGRRHDTYQLLRRLAPSELPIHRLASTLVSVAGLPGSPLVESLLAPVPKGEVFPQRR
jgi:hypothetical protein